MSISKIHRSNSSTENESWDLFSSTSIENDPVHDAEFNETWERQTMRSFPVDSSYIGNISSETPDREQDQVRTAASPAMVHWMHQTTYHIAKSGLTTSGPRYSTSYVDMLTLVVQFNTSLWVSPRQ